MRFVLIVLLLGIIFSSGTVSAQEPADAKCQILANQFSENPDSLAIQELERLRFCVNRALEHREQSLKGELLKGTIIESPSLSGGSPDTKTPTAPTGLEINP
jgi:hypothetical protein